MKILNNWYQDIYIIIKIWQVICLYYFDFKQSDKKLNRLVAV